MVLWGLSLIRYVALLSLSHYEVCRQLWGVSLIGFVTLWGLSLIRFVALLSLSQYEVCCQLWGVWLIEFVAVRGLLPTMGCIAYWVCRSTRFVANYGVSRLLSLSQYPSIWPSLSLIEALLKGLRFFLLSSSSSISVLSENYQTHNYLTFRFRYCAQNFPSGFWVKLCIFLYVLKEHHFLEVKFSAMESRP